MLRRNWISMNAPLLAGAFLAISFPSLAGAANERAGSFAAAFLHVPAGPKLRVLPGIFFGVRPDASLVFSNPAPLAEIPTGQVFLSSENWLDELTFSSASVSFPSFLRGLKTTLGARFLYSDGLKGYNDALEVVDEKSYYDLALSAALSGKIAASGLAVGGSITYIREHLAIETGRAVCFSLGLSYTRAGQCFQVLVKDLWGRLAFDGASYPIEGRVIAGYARNVRGTWGSALVGAQGEVSNGDEKRIRIGASYEMRQFLSLRVGLNHYLAGTATSEFPLTAGLGIRFDGLSLDYGFSPRRYFPSTHSFSITVHFGGILSSESEDKKRRDRSVPAASIRISPGGEEGQPGDARSAGKEEEFLLVAGIHDRLESASAEIRALKLLGIPAVLKLLNGKHAVCIGRYATRRAALAAMEEYRSMGYSFSLRKGGKE